MPRFTEHKFLVPSYGMSKEVYLWEKLRRIYMTLPIMSFDVTSDFSNLLMFLKMSVHQVGAESELIVFLISL